MAMTVEQAKKELADVNIRLKEYAALAQRKQMLEQFLVLAERLAGPVSKSATAQSQPIVMPKTETTICARDVLRKHGKLHLRALIAKMREVGWAGSSDSSKAEKTVYVNMYRNKGIFENLGKNIWRLRAQETKTAS
jgi:hypothetical protein